ncbi:L,D-transpeptidase [Streptosporangiaceae bacterium NEAU-GS5]|nr:L,D-transpeptidase [Streptosporangiaceae bacterium NEAU-GS5]
MTGMGLGVGVGVTVGVTVGVGVMIALHGWLDETVLGHAISHGCVRVPDAALRMLSRVPLGTIVTITS